MRATTRRVLRARNRALAKDAAVRRNANACAVLERTGDHVVVGRCWFNVVDGMCPRHGDVREVQREYVTTGRLTDELKLKRVLVTLTLEEWGALKSATDDGAPPKDGPFPKKVYDDLVARGFMRHRVGPCPDGKGEGDFYLTLPAGEAALKNCAVKP